MTAQTLADLGAFHLLGSFLIVRAVAPREKPSARPLAGVVVRVLARPLVEVVVQASVKLSVKLLVVAEAQVQVKPLVVAQVMVLGPVGHRDLSR